MRRLLRLAGDGFSRITLGPPRRLRALRLQQEALSGHVLKPLPPLPESAYTAEGALLEPQWWPPRSGGTPR
jgi:hypothetical protein